MFWYKHLFCQRYLMVLNRLVLVRTMPLVCIFLSVVMYHLAFFVKQEANGLISASTVASLSCPAERLHHQLLHPWSQPTGSIIHSSEWCTWHSSKHLHWYITYDTKVLYQAPCTISSVSIIVPPLNLFPFSPEELSAVLITLHFEFSPVIFSWHLWYFLCSWNRMTWSSWRHSLNGSPAIC